MRDVMLIGFFALLGALLPYALYANGLSLAATWRTASLALLLAWVLGYLTYLWANRQSKKSYFGVPLLPKAWSVSINPALVVLGNGLLAWNVILPGASSGGRYLFALLVLFLIAAFLFLNTAFGDRD